MFDWGLGGGATKLSYRWLSKLHILILSVSVENDKIRIVKVKLLRKINSKKSNYDEKLKKVFFVGKN